MKKVLDFIDKLHSRRRNRQRGKSTTTSGDGSGSVEERRTQRNGPSTSWKAADKGTRGTMKRWTTCCIRSYVRTVTSINSACPAWKETEEHQTTSASATAMSWSKEKTQTKSSPINPINPILPYEKNRPQLTHETSQRTTTRTKSQEGGAQKNHAKETRGRRKG